MSTLAADSVRIQEIGERNQYPVIASDIIYEGAAVGLVDGTGHARPLNAADRFVGFANKRADNSAGAAAAILVQVVEQGKVQLSVSGAVITDVGQPVYATDDDTFVFSPVGGVFIGYVSRFVSAGVVVVAFNYRWADPYGGYVHELKGTTYTVDAEDAGKWIWCDTDNSVITLPAVEGIAGLRIGNIAAFGAAKVSVDPAAADMIEGPDITAADNKDIINTKATARRGDFIELGNGDANGWSITKKRGIWAREA
jgi:hypothetical protein